MGNNSIFDRFGERDSLPQGGAGGFAGDDFVQDVVDRFMASESARRERENAWNTAYRRYRGLNDDSGDEYFLPETFTVVETILPRLTSDFLNRVKSPVSIEGRDPGDAERAEAVEALTAYQFQRDRISVKLVDFYRQALIYGTAIGKTYWDYRLKPRVRQKPVFQKSYNDFAGWTESHVGWENEEITEAVKDDPSFEVIPIYDFYIDPAATSIENARYCIHRKLLTREEIEELAEMGVYDADAVRGLPSEGAGQETDGKRTDLSISNALQEDGNGSLPGKFEILEYWEDNRVIVVADRQYKLRDEKNPYWHKKKPFVSAVYSQLPFEFYGLGIPELVNDLQEILNNIANSRLKNIKLSINKMWLRRPGAVSDDHLKTKPGGVIDVNGDINNSIKPLEFPDVTGSSYQEQNIILESIQTVTGATDYIKGITNQVAPMQTATEVRQKIQQASSRYTFVFKLMAEQCVSEIARFFIELSQQYITTEKTIKVLGKKAAGYRTLTPDDIQGEFDIIPCIDPTQADENNRRQAVMQFYQMCQGNQQAANIVNMRKLIEQVADVLELNSEEILLPEVNNGQNLQTANPQQLQQGTLPGGNGGLPQKPGMAQPARTIPQRPGNQLAGRPAVMPGGIPQP